MNICVITTVLDAYKGGNHLPLFAACNDCTFTILCNRNYVALSDLPPNVTVVTVPGRIGSYYYGFADFLFARLVIKKFPLTSSFWKEFSLIHLNQVMGPAFTTLKHTRIPLLFFIHHPVTADREVAVEESGCLDAIRWRFKYFLLVWWQKKLCASADHVATVSNTMRDRIAKDYYCSVSKISVIPNGVDGAIFTTVPDSACTHDVIAVGSFVHPRKGFSYLLTVYQALSKEGYTIADVGRRTDEQREALAAIEGVTVYDTVDSDTLVYRMRHARVLISTSLFEGFGLSLIEALACGHPAFAFAGGAVPEVLGGIDASLVIQPRDITDMTNSVCTYLDLSPSEREKNGAQFRKSVLGRYPIDLSATPLQKVYKQMLS